MSMQIFENTPLDRTRHAFSMQFEEEGDGYVYRQSQRGPAYPISAGEYASYIWRYTARVYTSAFVLVASWLGVVFAVGTYTDQMPSPPPDETIITAIIISGVVMLIGYFAAAQWFWTAPARALSRRSAVQMDRSSDEAADAKYSKISWSQLVFGAAAIGFLILKFGHKYDLTQGPGLIFSGLITLGAFVLLYQTVQKFRRS